MKLIIFGAPGSGKGTQAKLLSKTLKLKHFSTGEVFRREYNKKTKLGMKAHDNYWGKGNLCPDNITNKIVLKNLPKENYLLDGYPRTLNQAKFLDKHNAPDLVVVLDAPLEVMKNRLLKRASIEGRGDDSLHIIEKRFRSYRKDSLPLIKYYKNKLVVVKGNKAVEEIEKEILRILKNGYRSSKIKS